MTHVLFLSTGRHAYDTCVVITAYLDTVIVAKNVLLFSPQEVCITDGMLHSYNLLLCYIYMHCYAYL